MGTLLDLCDDMRSTFLSTRYEIHKHMRRWRLLVALILAVLLPMLFYLVPIALGDDFPETTEGFARNGLGFVYLLVIICAALFAGDTVAIEFENKTGFTIFPLPHRRSSVFLGKYLGALIATATMILLYYFIIFAQMLSIYEFSEIGYEFYLSCMMAMLYVLAVVGLTFFFSSLFKKSLLSTLLSFFSLFLIFPIVETVLWIAEIDPWFILTYNANLITNVYGAAPIEIPGFFTMTVADYAQGVWVMAGYAIVTLVLGLFLAVRREME